MNVGFTPSVAHRKRHVTEENTHVRDSMPDVLIFTLAAAAAARRNRGIRASFSGALVILMLLTHVVVVVFFLLRQVEKSKHRE